MRIPLLVALLLAAPIGAVAGQAMIPVVTVRAGSQLGPEVALGSYAEVRRGDWHTGYTKWLPVPLYVVNGRFYRRHVRGARPVVVYWYQNEYFLPPQQNAWLGWDKRYDYRRQPLVEDWARVRVKNVQ